MSQTTPSRMSITVTKETAGARLDVFLSTTLATVSRNRAAELCKQGAVLINGKKSRPGIVVKIDDVVEVEAVLEAVSASAEQANGIKLQVLYEDTELAVFFKPRGMPAVRLSWEDGPTAADCAVLHDPKFFAAGADPREGGLVHRLDNWTSGALLAAKSRDIWEVLRDELFAGQIEKSYLAVVEGEPKWQTKEIEYDLLQRSDGKSMSCVKPGTTGALSAVSLVEVVCSKPQPQSAAKFCSVVRIKAPRARRHQIRAHLAKVGHPLWGDSQYGAKHELKELPAVGTLKGFLLHAETISFRNPRTQEEITAVGTSEEIEKVMSI